MRKPVSLDISKLEWRIQVVGEDWAIAHARRLLKLIEIIAENRSYDHQALQWAAYFLIEASFTNTTSRAAIMLPSPGKLPKVRSYQGSICLHTPKASSSKP